MRNRVLFVTSVEREAAAFEEAASQADFDVDTAVGGIEGAILAKKNTYAVLITNLKMSGYDGNQLISYFHQAHAQTVCIVIETKLNVADLTYLYNQQNVFRVYLRPVEYKAGFIQTISEAEELYLLRMKKEDEGGKLKAEHEQSKQELQTIQSRLEDSRQRREHFTEMMFRMIPASLQMLSSELNEVEKRQAKIFEQAICKQFLQFQKQPCGSVQEVEEYLQYIFKVTQFKQVLKFKQKECGKTAVSGMFYEKLRFILWMVIYRCIMLSKQYEIDVNLEFINPSQATLYIDISLPLGVWQYYNETPMAQFFTSVVQEILAAATNNLVVEMKHTTLSYTAIIE